MLFRSYRLERKTGTKGATVRAQFFVAAGWTFGTGWWHKPVLVDHEKPVLCDNYIVEFVHDATENYYKRGKYGWRSFYFTKTPLSMLLLFYLPILEALCFIDLFSYKIRMHRKRVRLKST